MRTLTKDRIEVYQDKGGEWRWRRIARNNRIVADSGEGYETQQGAQRAADREMQADVSQLPLWALVLIGLLTLLIALALLVGYRTGLNRGYDRGYDRGYRDGQVARLDDEHRADIVAPSPSPALSPPLTSVVPEETSPGQELPFTQ